MFKIGILFGDGPKMIPSMIAPGYEISEIPAEVFINPLLTDEEWEIKKKEILSWNLPPIRVASHWIGKPCTIANTDWELLEFWTRRILKRLSSLNVEIAGVYGLWFPKVEGYSLTRQIDQAIRYANFLGDTAARYKINIALEPMADMNTLFPTYKEGLEFVKKVSHPNVKIMADLNYFIKLNQSFEVIKEAPELCLHGHIAGRAPEAAQPNVGGIEEIHKAFFRVFRDIGYTRGISAACPWINTGKREFSIKKETAKALMYIQKLREEVYNE